jgi:hypothetical protein
VGGGRRWGGLITPPLWVGCGPVGPTRTASASMTPTQAKGWALAIKISVLLVPIGAVLLWGFERAAAGGIPMAVGTIGVFVAVSVAMRAAAVGRTGVRGQGSGTPADADGGMVEPARLHSRAPHEPRSS